MLYILAFIFVLGAFILAPKTVLKLCYILLCAIVGLPIGFLWGLFTPRRNPARQARMRYVLRVVKRTISNAKMPIFPRIRVRVPILSWWIDCYQIGRRYPGSALRGLYYGVRLSQWLRFK